MSRCESFVPSLSQSVTEVPKCIPSVTFEDELYARTVRTVHLIVVRQLSINDMYNLLELQNANGAIISFDHAHNAGGSIQNLGGVPAWLEAGSQVFQAKMRERVQNPIAKALFPRGVPLGLMGDGSTDRSLAEQARPHRPPTAHHPLAHRSPIALPPLAHRSPTACPLSAHRRQS